MKFPCRFPSLKNCNHIIVNKNKAVSNFIKLFIVITNNIQEFFAEYLDNRVNSGGK